MNVAAAFETRTSTSSQISAGSGATLVLAQMVSSLEKSFPELKELDLQDMVESLPVAGADGLAENLGGIGEIAVSELLGFVSLLLSGAALLKAREEASEIRARAREISTSADEIEAVSSRLMDVEHNCANVCEQLRCLDYNQFKLSWCTQQLLKRYRREFGLPRRYRGIVDAFAAHTKRYWATLVTDVHSMTGEARHVGRV